MTFTPIAKQAEAIQYLKDHDKALLCLAAGYGKTPVTLMAMPDDFGQLVIVVPPVVLLHWQRQIAKFRPGLGRIQVLKSTKQKMDPAANITIISYGVLVNRTKLGGPGVPKPDVLVIDEGHWVKTWNKTVKGKKYGQRTGAVRHLAKAAKKLYILTATPIPNRCSELGVLLHMLGAIKHKRAFEAEYCSSWTAPWGYVADGSKPDIPGIHALLEPVMFCRGKEDLKDVAAGRLPPRVLELDLPVDKREKAFDKKEIVKNLNPVAFVGLSELMQKSGVKKVPLALSHITGILESEESVLVFAWHEEVMDLLCDGLKKYGVVRIDGKTKDKGAAAEEFQTGPARVAVLNYIAGGVGIDMFKSSYVCFAECPWPPGVLEQAICRADRTGQEEVVRVDILTINRSIDAHVIHTLIDKENIINRVITPTGVEEMSKIFTGLDKSLLRAIEFRAEELELDLDEWIIGAQGQGGEKPADEDAPKPGKPAKKKVAKKKAAKKVEPEPEEEEETTIDEVRLAMRKHMQKNGGPATREILEMFDAKKLSEVSAEEFDNLIEALK